MQLFWQQKLAFPNKKNKKIKGHSMNIWWTNTLIWAQERQKKSLNSLDEEKRYKQQELVQVKYTRKPLLKQNTTAGENLLAQLILIHLLYPNPILSLIWQFFPSFLSYRKNEKYSSDLVKICSHIKLY